MEGWDDVQDRAWEPLTQLREYVPGLVKDFLQSPGQRNLKAQILGSCY